MSAKVDENDQWFDTPMPGRLSDVFGISTEEFYRPGTPPEIDLNGKVEKASIGFYEVLETHTAIQMGSRSIAVSQSTNTLKRTCLESSRPAMPLVGPIRTPANEFASSTGWWRNVRGR